MRGSDGFPVRLRFAKRGKVRFISHRDLARCFERAFRIVELPLAFTQGFSPRPKVSFGLALSVAHESVAEYLDVELREPVDLAALPTALTDALPEGLDVTGAVALANRAPALQEAVTATAWEIELVDTDGLPPAPSAVARLAATALDASSLPITRVRKGREAIEDIRPSLRRLEVQEPSHLDDPVGVVLTVEVATQPVSVRPGELLEACLPGLGARRTLRTNQWIERDGVRLEPLDADPRGAPEARAS
jgi:radical SAM-linked protein